MTPEYVPPDDQRLLIGRAKLRAYRFPKGKSGNPGGLSKFYFEARRLARQAAPEMMRVLIELANDRAADERVRSVCAVAILDRAGVRPVDFDPNEEKDNKPPFNPRDYTPEELDVIEAALRLIARRQEELSAGRAQPLAGPEEQDCGKAVPWRGNRQTQTR